MLLEATPAKSDEAMPVPAAEIEDTKRKSRLHGPLAGVVYVLHVFQKKSKRGIATPRKELDLIR